MRVALKTLRLTILVTALFLAAGAMAAEAAEFLLGPGDTLDISVWNDETLTREVLVRPDGAISFPLIGDVPVAGMTVDQVRREVESRIREYVSNAPVTVILSKLASARIFVVGKVAEPGQYPLVGPTRVIQALAMAGGLTTFADEDSILVAARHRRGAAGHLLRLLQGLGRPGPVLEHRARTGGHRRCAMTGESDKFRPVPARGTAASGGHDPGLLPAGAVGLAPGGHGRVDDRA